MKILRYYESANRTCWKNKINSGDWSAAKLLFSLLDKNELKKRCGASSEVYLLTDDDNLVSFAVLSEQDEVDAKDLSPWIGFVYTFPEYRGNHYAGKLIKHICDIAKSNKASRIYIPTDANGLYEKYGFSFFKTMDTKDGKPTRVYIKDLF